MERRIGAERSKAIGVHWIRNSRQDPVGATRDGVTLHMRWLMGLAIVIDPGTGLNHRARVWDAIIAEGGVANLKVCGSVCSIGVRRAESLNCNSPSQDTPIRGIASNSSH